jgi:hypothetical protein
MKRAITRATKDWMDLEQALQYHRSEGFEVGRSLCLLCDQSMWCAHPAGTDTHRLECLYCGGFNSEFSEYQP